jgi:hypothetical protein
VKRERQQQQTSRRFTISTPTIAIVNANTQITDQQIESFTKALQIQADRDYSKFWGQSAKLVFVPKGQQPPKGAWWVACLDDADGAGYLGYHDVTNEGLPLGKAFFATDLRYGYNPSVTLSHELLEMLEDPYISYCVQVEKDDGSLRDYALEVCDACEADADGYKIADVVVSDFVTPAWFEPYRKSGQFDYMNKIKKPFELLRGGYISYIDFNSGAGWQQIEGDRVEMSRQEIAKGRAPIGSRRERRRTRSSAWQESEVDFSISPDK